jgi:probable regulatory domain-containing protein
MIVLTEKELTVDETGLERLVERVFFKSLDLLGGLKRLTEFRTLTWLPSLARAAFAVVLREEYLKSEEEIAEYVGLTRMTVRTILRADTQAAMEKIAQAEESEKARRELKVHVAGGVAKLAYRLVKEGQESRTLLDFCHGMAGETLQAAQCDSPWAYQVLKATKGIDYPIIESEPLARYLRQIRILGIPGEEVAAGLSYPIKNPAQLLREIKEYLQSRGEG